MQTAEADEDEDDADKSSESSLAANGDRDDSSQAMDESSQQGYGSRERQLDESGDGRDDQHEEGDGDEQGDRSEVRGFFMVERWIFNRDLQLQRMSDLLVVSAAWRRRWKRPSFAGRQCRFFRYRAGDVCLKIR